MQQQRNMGIMFRKQYGTLLEQQYSPTMVAPWRLSSSLTLQVNILSTDLDRTIMSAESQLAGWFPPVQSPFNDSALMWRPMPVHSTGTDFILRAGGEALRARLIAPKTSALASSSSWRRTPSDLDTLRSWLLSLRLSPARYPLFLLSIYS
jgi:hypothetical protein